ncbi:Transcription factor MYB3R-5 [Hondaea fermentalgiana]|uniref:Transcription factor MYB3R-5 n=1 Tax=Hondaea fermentalgiana TaxID=2315210 RepID=A0A2R5GPW3_9STRA|nr:Transcription factor MYB3R-5 [Hondaea fermentalgiana]|eukprot:GBG32907.1 Transcription factor MYB3R-5 [Hondaea fermentalgiana]
MMTSAQDARTRAKARAEDGDGDGDGGAQTQTQKVRGGQQQKQNGTQKRSRAYETAHAEGGDEDVDASADAALLPEDTQGDAQQDADNENQDEGDKDAENSRLDNIAGQNGDVDNDDNDDNDKDDDDDDDDDNNNTKDAESQNNRRTPTGEDDDQLDGEGNENRDMIDGESTGLTLQEAEAIASGRPPWADIEEQVLRTTVNHYEGKEWDKIARFLPERTEAECRAHWRKMSAIPPVTKGSWTAAEDANLRKVVGMHGPQNWSSFIANHFPNRTGKQCRERWRNHLDPDLKRGPWSPEEERTLIEMHQRVGNRWSLIARKLPGRSDNDVKNHWYASQRRLKTRMQVVSGVYASHGDGEETYAPGSSFAAGAATSLGKRARKDGDDGADAGPPPPPGSRKAQKTGTTADTQTHAARGKRSGVTADESGDKDQGQEAAGNTTAFAAFTPPPPGESALGQEEEEDAEQDLRWDAAEGAVLLDLVTTHGTGDWNLIAKDMPRRTALQCARHWNNVLNPSIVKGRGSWTPAEDAKLRSLVEKYGPTKWTIQIAPYLPGRIGKQCRERWFNSLQPNLRRGEWTEAEIEKFRVLHKENGNHWAAIARELPGRSANDVKNHFYASKRRERRQSAKNRRNGDDAASAPASGAAPPPAPIQANAEVPTAFSAFAAGTDEPPGLNASS